MPVEQVSRFVRAPDGLKLHVRDYRGESAARLPAVCLPGLARTEADFATLAEALAAAGRRVLAIDARGRGRSDRDPDPANYNLAVESADVLAVLAEAGVDEAVFVGTSRGGLVTMALAPEHGALIRGAVLNDIGPVLEADGLARIRGYVGKLPQPRSWEDAVATLKRVAGSQFTAIGEEDWLGYAQLTFRESESGLLARYDPALAQGLAALDLAAIPTLWPQFEALACPVLVIRGENSDLLSPATVEEMAMRHPDCALHTVPGQGHAPFLSDRATVRRIVEFASRCDRDAMHASPASRA